MYIQPIVNHKTPFAFQKKVPSHDIFRIYHLVLLFSYITISTGSDEDLQLNLKKKKKKKNLLCIQKKNNFDKIFLYPDKTLKSKCIGTNKWITKYIFLLLSAFFYLHSVTFKTHQLKWFHIYHDWLIWHHLCVMWTGGSVVESRLCFLWLLVIAPVAGDHSMHCWWSLLRLSMLHGITCQIF